MVYSNKFKWVEKEFPEAYWFQEGPGIRNWQFTESGVRFIRVANISEVGTINLDTTDRYISREEAENNYKHFLLDAGDLVIASSGISFDSSGFLRVKAGFIREEHLPLSLNTGIIRFKEKNGISDINFLKFWFYSFEFRQQIQRVVTGIAQQHFGPSHLQSIKITLPPLPEQKRIAAILEKCDRLRRTRRYSLQISETFLQSVFLEMFGDSFKNSKNWEYKQLGDVITNLTDYHANGSYEILKQNVELLNKPDYALMVRTTDLENQDFSTDVKYISQSAYEFLAKSKLFGGEIIINKIGSAGQVYLMPYLNRYASLAMNQFLIRINEKKCINIYIYYLLMSDYGKAILDKCIRGAVTKTITKDAIRELDIPLPPLPLQEKFAQIVQKHDRIRTQQREAERQAEHLFQTLLHRAFRGELTSSDYNEVDISALSAETHPQQPKPKSTDKAENLPIQATQPQTNALQLTLPGLE